MFSKRLREKIRVSVFDLNYSTIFICTVQLYSFLFDVVLTILDFIYDESLQLEKIGLPVPGHSRYCQKKYYIIRSIDYTVFLFTQ